jgi:hypothetical protein
MPRLSTVNELVDLYLSEQSNKGKKLTIGSVIELDGLSLAENRQY